MITAARSVIALALLLSTIGWSSQTMRAQAELLPAVTLSEVALTGEAWPGRFNSDGITDLVATDPSTGNIAVRFGRGDGTLGGAIVSPVKASVKAVRDVNRDGRLDVVAMESGYDGGRMYVLRGNGDGTFTIATTFATGYYTFALVEDFDRDGHRDLALGEEPSSLHMFRGFGDFTFAPPITYEGGIWPHGAIAVDLNADNRLDIAVANRYSRDVSIFRNGGGMLLTRTDIALGRSATDVTARDVNGDTRVDLIVSARGERDDDWWTEGVVYVFPGDGNGTFGTPATYETTPGTQSVVVGDFTRDGKLDIATASQSSGYIDHPCSYRTNVDSVSLLAGNGDGTFKPHTSFSLSKGPVWAGRLLDNSVFSLNTNDLNGDGHTDLIVSPGVLLLNQAPRANRPPVATAGEDQRSPNSEMVLRGDAIDPDGHFLQFAWVHSRGEWVAPVPHTCGYAYGGTGEHTFTFTVDDGHGGRASDDMTFTLVSDAEPTVQVTAPAAGAILQAGQPYEITWTVSHPHASLVSTMVQYSEDDGRTFATLDECTGGAVLRCTWAGPARPTDLGRIRVIATVEFGMWGYADSGRFSVRSASGANTLPAGWFNQDIGAVGAAGRASYRTGVYTVAGSGADVWGTADELHFAHTRIDGDFDFVARVASVQNLDKWVKAGLMVREHTGAGARHAFAIATPRTERGIAFQRRPTEGGISLHTAGPAVAPPALLHLRRRGTTIEAFYRSTETSAWTFIGRQSFSGLATSLLVGFAVSSHVDGTLATATFDHVSLLRLSGPPLHPTPWSSLDIGAVGASGANAYIGPGAWSIAGSGADVWGTADEMRYTFTRVLGDFDVSTRVTSVQNLDKWVKAGLMIRETPHAGSRHAFAIATPRTERGVAFQRRPTTGGLSVHTAGPAWAPPLWLKLSRRGDVITAHYRRTLTGAWVQYGTQTYSGLPAALLVGFAVSSHIDGQTAQAGFDFFSIDAAK